MFIYPKDCIKIRFGTSTPYWMLSSAYCCFQDELDSRNYISLDHYIGYHQLLNYDDQQIMLATPNGYIANQTLKNIAQHNREAIDPDFANKRFEIAVRGVRCKMRDNPVARQILLKTQQREIYDCSRAEDNVFCHANGEGLNIWGKALMQVREELLK